MKSLKIRQNLFGENHSFTAQSLNNLGFLYNILGNLEKAEEFYLKSLKICQNLFSENHSDVDNLGTLYDNLGNLRKLKNFI